MWRNVAQILQAPLQSLRDWKSSFLAHGCHISLRLGSLRGSGVSSRVSYTPIYALFSSSRAGACSDVGPCRVVPGSRSVGRSFVVAIYRRLACHGLDSTAQLCVRSVAR